MCQLPMGNGNSKKFWKMCHCTKGEMSESGDAVVGSTSRKQPQSSVADTPHCCSAGVPSVPPVCYDVQKLMKHLAFY